jgi:ribose transport system ATP-binding protein/rhamnose transport system ATP-binding protein
MTARLTIAGISKSFPGARALDGVSIHVEQGEIHALLGENGAGKSTLGKIIAGAYRADEGTVALDGIALGPIDEKEAGRLGIGIVHQEGSLVGQLSVAENVFAGRQPTRAFGRIDRRAMNDRAREIIGRLGVAIEPRRRVDSLSSAEAQVVEIAKCLSQDLKILILDEPTAALTLAETEKLFDIVRALAAQGVSVIYVSHRLAEIFALCHRVSVLKDGRHVGTAEVADVQPSDLIRMMVGREVLLSRQARAASPGDVVLEVRHLAAPPPVRDMSLTVRAGEIVCVAGLIGAGRSELCETVFGLRPRQSGEVRLFGQPFAPSAPIDSMRAGIGMVPEDRKQAGLFLDMSVRDNVTVALSRARGRGFRHDAAADGEVARRFIDALRIATPSDRQIVGNLSGGNQQKVMLAKWLALDPRLLIVDEPTRGVDVGARAEIYRLLRDLAAGGVALLVVSSDLPEVLTLADRVVVMADGRLAGELPGGEATEEAILALATRFTILPGERRPDERIPA